MSADPTFPRGTRGLTDSQRFWAKVRIAGPDECWTWTAYIARDGYGRFPLRTDDGLQRFPTAHRACWLITRGPIPAGLFVCHTCDNPPCVNPGHLFLGTQAENLRDMDAKGRRRIHNKGTPVRRPLVAAQVLEMRTRWAAGGVSKNQLARDYDISRSTVYSVLRRETWRHVA